MLCVLKFTEQHRLELGVLMLGAGVNLEAWVAVDTLQGSFPETQFSGVYCFLLTTAAIFLGGNHRTKPSLRRKGWFLLCRCVVSQHMIHSKRLVFILKNKSTYIKMPWSFIWSAAVRKVHRFIFDPLFSTPDPICWNVLIIIITLSLFELENVMIQYDICNFASPVTSLLFC